MLISSQSLSRAHSTTATANSLSSAMGLFFTFQINRLIQEVAYMRLISLRMACISVHVGTRKYPFLFMTGSYSIKCIKIIHSSAGRDLIEMCASGLLLIGLL